MATLLELVRDVFVELGLDAPNAVVSSSDASVKQVYYLMNRVGDQLISDGYDWQALKSIHQITCFATSISSTTTSGSTTITVADTSTLSAGIAVSGTGIPDDTHIVSIDSGTNLTIDWPATATGSVTLTYTQDKYTLPADFEKIIVGTTWDKTQSWKLSGSKSSQEWQYLTSGLISTTPIKKWRIYQGKFQLFPYPANGDRITYEYMSSYWAQNSGGTNQAKFTADTDVSRLPDRLLTLGTKLKFWEIKGFDSSSLAVDFRNTLQVEKSKDSSLDALSLDNTAFPILLGRKNIPDSGYGS